MYEIERRLKDGWTREDFFAKGDRYLRLMFITWRRTVDKDSELYKSTNSIGFVSPELLAKRTKQNRRVRN